MTKSTTWCISQRRLATRFERDPIPNSHCGTCSLAAWRLNGPRAISGAYWRRVFFSIGGLVAATTCSLFHHRCESGTLPPSQHSDKTTPDKTTQLQKKYYVKNS